VIGSNRMAFQSHLFPLEVAVPGTLLMAVGDTAPRSQTPANKYLATISDSLLRSFPAPQWTREKRRRIEERGEKENRRKGLGKQIVFYSVGVLSFPEHVV
jgi:hypothetical protein